jgi:hypothetical protein
VAIDSPKFCILKFRAVLVLYRCGNEDSSCGSMFARLDACHNEKVADAPGVSMYRTEDNNHRRDLSVRSCQFGGMMISQTAPLLSTGPKNSSAGGTGARKFFGGGV